eukprot:5765318-Ditylum_brightwellii.AAC.1
MNLPSWGLPLPMYEEVYEVIIWMANGKSPGMMGVILDEFHAMVWCEEDPAQAGLNGVAEYLCQYIADILRLF